MGTMEKAFAALTEKAPGLTVEEVAAIVKPRGVKSPIIATRSALQRLRRADKARGEKCADGAMRWRKA